MSSEERQFICDVSPVNLAGTSWRRISPRPVEFQQDGYAEKFDWTYLFYDVFWSDGQLYLIGPPLMNFADLFKQMVLFIDGTEVADAAETVEMDRMSLTRVACRDAPVELRLRGGAVDLSVSVQPSYSDAFAGKSVIATMSRDNELTWIRDWAEWHARLHGVDGVIIYDNNSTRTEPSDILETLRSLELFESIAVVRWTLPYGIGKSPAGGSWDSDFSQYVTFGHALRRFLRRARAYINLDIDELLVAESSIDLLSALEASDSGIVTFNGHWVVNTSTQPQFPVRHAHSVMMDREAANPRLKWAMDPGRLDESIQPLVHGFSKGAPAASGDFRYRHFRAVNTGWKWRRSDVQAHDPERHVVDTKLLETMVRIGWRSP